MYYGTIITVGPSEKRNKITIMVKDIVKDPSEEATFSKDTTMVFTAGEDDFFKVKV
jgi:hypothetical protein